MLYRRLFKYAPRDKTPLENFLTEALCDLLERITSSDRSAGECFIKRAFLAETEASSKIFSKIHSAEHLTWNTQYTFKFNNECGRPDLCLSAGADIILVIENKVGAGLTTHSAPGGIDDRDTRNQLEFYDDWLATTYPEAGLVLLTHLTDAPPGFVEYESVPELGEGVSSHRYKAAFRRECRWTNVYECLLTWCDGIANQTQYEEQTVSRALTREFCSFLRENSMGLRKIENKDLELLDSFFSQEILNTFKQLSEIVRTAVIPVIPNAQRLPKSLPQTHAWGRDEVIWDWSYCYENTLDWYLGWGFAAKNAFKGSGIVLPDSLQAFVVLASDVTNIPLQQHELARARQQGWVDYNPPPKRNLALIKTLNPQHLAASAEGFNRAFQDWVVGTIREGVGILGAAHSASMKSE